MYTNTETNMGENAQKITHPMGSLTKLQNLSKK